MNINPKCGIYAMICKKTGRAYIGSSKDIKNRFTEHKRDLLNRRHHNKYLENHFHKHGGWEIFETKILEECLEKDLIDKERYWASQFSNLFNLAEIRKGHIQVKTYRVKNPLGEIIQITNMKEFCRNKNLNPMSMYLVGNGKQSSYKGYTSITYKKKIRYDQVKFKLKSPDGKIYEGSNVWKFSKEHGLEGKNLYKVIYGERPHHKGWTLSY